MKRPQASDLLKACVKHGAYPNRLENCPQCYKEAPTADSINLVLANGEEFTPLYRMGFTVSKELIEDDLRIFSQSIRSGVNRWSYDTTTT